jgi:hypothetical protein
VNDEAAPVERPRHEHDAAANDNSLPQWWTEADEAEVDVIKYELVLALARHWAKHEGCCSERGLCARAEKAVAAAREHVERMALRSRAASLREQQNLVDEGHAA